MGAEMPLLVTTRSVEERGVWLSLDESQVWVPGHELTELVDAAVGDFWVRVSSQSIHDALVAHELVVVDATSAASVRATPELVQRWQNTELTEGTHTYLPQHHGPFYPGDPGTETFMSWAETEKGMKRCSACQAAPWTFQLSPGDGRAYVEYDNALFVSFDGGYGQFIDPLDSSERERHRVVLCHQCSHRLCEQNPWLSDLLQPERSHAHTERFWADNPEHRGWDDPSRDSDDAGEA